MSFNLILNINDEIIRLIYLFRFEFSLFIKLKNVVEDISNY